MRYCIKINREFELPDIKTIEDSKWVPLDQYCEVKEVENNSKMLGFCDTLKKNIGKSQIKLGFLYYEWKKEASIIGKGEVVVYSKVRKYTCTMVNLCFFH